MGKALERALTKEIAVVEKDITNNKNNLEAIATLTPTLELNNRAKGGYYDDILQWINLRELYLGTLYQLQSLGEKK